MAAVNVEGWHDSGQACTYTDADLLAMAKQAARDKGGKLVDYRIIVRAAWVTVQTRVRLADGSVVYHNTAI